MKPEVLILAGGDISERLQFIKSGTLCPALLPVHTKYLAARVIDAYEKHDVDLHLFVDKAFEDTVSEQLDLKHHECKLHALPDTKNVIESLNYACKQTEGKDLIVNLVTTVPTIVPEHGDIQIADLPRRGDWSAISSDEQVIHYHKKGSSSPESAKAFTGVFRVYRDNLTKAIEASGPSRDLLAVIENLENVHPSNLSLVEWLDFGHEGNFHRSLARLISSRSFNSIQIDRARGIVIKSSKDKKKLALEVDYLTGLPERLKVLFPRVLSRRDGDSGADSYEMEYYAYPCLSEYLLFWDLSEETWWRCFEALDTVIINFRGYPASIGVSAYQKFFEEKTMLRIDQFLSECPEPNFSNALEKGYVNVNGKILPDLASVKQILSDGFSSFYREDCFCVSHGDLCFNNILFDHVSGIVRLIDPRGSFGENFPGIYGDTRYDLAKLAHSTIGGYDYIVNGFYRLTGGSSEWSLTIDSREADAWLENMTDWILGRHCEEPEFIRLIMASLFLSMCPLHADDPRRQIALFLRGMQIIADINEV